MVKFGLWLITEAEADCLILKDIYSPPVLFVCLSTSIKSCPKQFERSKIIFGIIEGQDIILVSNVLLNLCSLSVYLKFEIIRPYFIHKPHVHVAKVEYL